MVNKKEGETCGCPFYPPGAPCEKCIPGLECSVECGEFEWHCPQICRKPKGKIKVTPLLYKGEL